MNEKLKLNKEVVAQLTDDSMNRIEGGGAVTFTNTCTGQPTCIQTGMCDQNHQSFCACNSFRCVDPKEIKPTDIGT